MYAEGDPSKLFNYIFFNYILINLAKKKYHNKVILAEK